MYSEHTIAPIMDPEGAMGAILLDEYSAFDRCGAAKLVLVRIDCRRHITSAVAALWIIIDTYQNLCCRGADTKCYIALGVYQQPKVDEFCEQKSVNFIKNFITARTINGC